jgi:hypothetical protein
MVIAWLGLRYVNMIGDIYLHVSDKEKHFTELPEMCSLVSAKDSWWGRAWTLQEFVLGRKLTFCSGKERCSDINFVEYMWCLVKHFNGVTHDDYCKSLITPNLFNNFDVPLFDNVLHIFDIRIEFHGNKAANLLRLTLNHQDCVASDPGDKVFAFIGMANSNSVPSNLVQYGVPALHGQYGVKIAPKDEYTRGYPPCCQPRARRGTLFRSSWHVLAKSERRRMDRFSEALYT